MKATIDRFEEDVAVLIVRGDIPTVIHLPRWLLPEDCREGDILDLSISKDEESTAAAKKRVSDLIEKLKKKSAD